MNRVRTSYTGWYEGQLQLQELVKFKLPENFLSNLGNWGWAVHEILDSSLCEDYV